MTVELTDDERASLICIMRDEAAEDCEKLGCTCEPTFELTPFGIGPHNLPAWITEHTDDCVLSQALRKAT